MTVAFFRKTDADIKEVIGSVRKCLETDIAIGIAWNLYETELSLTKESMTELTTNLFLDTRGCAQLTGIGLGSSIVGKHYDKMFTDDICNQKDRISKAEREATKAAYGELGNILNDRIAGNPYVGVMCNTGTPWHRDDVYQLMPEPIVYTYHDTSILSDEKIARQKKMLTPSLFAANYELKHVSNEGQLFKDPKYCDDMSKFLYGSAHVDCAFGGDNYTALTIMQEHDDEKGNTKYYAIGWVWHKHVQKCYGEIKRVCKDFKVDIIYLEDNADKGYVSSEMDMHGMWTKPYHENQNKDVKISTYLYAAWLDMYWHPETDPEYLTQIIDYVPTFEPDDAPDSCASILREVMNTSTAFIM